MASTGVAAHGNNEGLGQNVHHSKNLNDQCSHEDIATTVNIWYMENRTYHYRDGRSTKGAPTGHFTQVVWKGTKKIGCSCTPSAKGSFSVCNYNPPGNQKGQFTENVQKP